MKRTVHYIIPPHVYEVVDRFGQLLPQDRWEDKIIGAIQAHIDDLCYAINVKCTLITVLKDRHRISLRFIDDKEATLFKTFYG